MLKCHDLHRKLCSRLPQVGADRRRDHHDQDDDDHMILFNH